MDFYSDSEQQAGKVDGEEYRELEGTGEERAEREPEREELSRSRMARRNKPADAEGEAEANPYPSSRTSSKSRTKPGSSNKKINMKMPQANWVIKIVAVIGVLINLRFLLGLMKDPAGSYTFYHLLVELAISAGVNFAAVWILFAKRSRIRYYLSLFAVLGSFLYYFYVKYTDHTLLVKSDLIPSVLVVLSVLMMISRANYYLKSILLLVIAAAGIYAGSNQFALEWVLMGSAGLVMFFRVSKTKSKDKSAKKEGRGGRNQRQSA